MLHNQVGSIVLPEPRSYLDEITKSDGSDDFFIVNREEDIRQIMSVIASSDYPNIALVGPPGIGKSISVRYIVDIITGNTQLPDNHPWKDLVQRCRERVRAFQKRDYLFLPNLSDPYSPYALSYAEGRMENANKQATEFSNEIVTFLEGVAFSDRIRPSFSEGEYRQYVKSRSHEVFSVLYKELFGEVGDSFASFEINVKPDFAYTFSHEFLEAQRIKEKGGDKKTTDAAIRSYLLGTRNNPGPYRKFRLKHYIYGEGREGKERAEKISLVGMRTAFQNYLRDKVRPNLLDFLAITKNAHVYKDSENMGELDQNERHIILKDALDNVARGYKDISRFYFQNDMLEFTRQLSKSFIQNEIGLKLDPKGLEWCAQSIGGIAAKHRGSDDQLNGWIDSIARHFSHDNETFAQDLLDYYRFMIREMMMNTFAPYLSIAPILEGPRSSDYRGSDSNLKKPSFYIQHGRPKLDMRSVMRPKPYAASASGELNVKYPTTITEDALFGHIENVDELGTRAEQINPPHRRFTPGYLVESGFLVMLDNMRAFFKALLTTEEKEAQARRQQMLEYFQSGRLVYSRGGVTFTLESPTLILGTDNDTPFLMQSDANREEYKYDDAMASRFHQIVWHGVDRNEPKTRRGTLYVIRKAVEDFNSSKKSNIALSPEVTDYLLVDNSGHEIISTDYRSLVRKVEAYLKHASDMEDGKVTFDTLRDFARRNDPRVKFMLVAEREHRNVMPVIEKGAGMVNGVALYGELGNILPIRSKVLRERAEDSKNNFILSDLIPKLLLPDALKGYRDAVDFIKAQTDEPIYFTVNTSLDRSFSTVGGPSASLPISVAMWTGITGEEIYQNRFYTGTMSFFDGSVGPIGGVYDKAATVWKWGQLQREKGREGQCYFVFPAENYTDLKNALRVSPYGVEKEVELVPVLTFPQALYLGVTCNVSGDHIRNLDKHAREYFQDKSLPSFKSRVKEINETVLNGYSR